MPIKPSTVQSICHGSWVLGAAAWTVGFLLSAARQAAPLPGSRLSAILGFCIVVGLAGAGLVLGIVGTVAARRARQTGPMAAAITGLALNGVMLTCVGLGVLLAVRAALVGRLGP